MAPYLISNPPTRSQFRRNRRKQVRPVIVVHTAENKTDFSGVDPSAESVANFIRTRSTPGSYHMIADADSLLHLIPFEYEAFGDGTGSNQFAIHISAAVAAADWNKLGEEREKKILNNLAACAGHVANWLEQRGYDKPAALRITKAQSNRATASGFISHGDRDPSRRSDPGSLFNWPLFLDLYRQHAGFSPMTSAFSPSSTPLPTTSVDTSSPLAERRNLQRIIGVTGDGDIGPVTKRALEANWLALPGQWGKTLESRHLTEDKELIKWAQRKLNKVFNSKLALDGDFGPKTDEVIKRHLTQGGIVDTFLFEWLAARG